MVRSPDDVKQNIKRALHKTHTTSQSVTNNLQHRETLNTPMDHLEDFFQTPTKSLSFLLSAPRIITSTNKKKKNEKTSSHPHSSDPWISSFSVTLPHFDSFCFPGD